MILYTMSKTIEQDNVDKLTFFKDHMPDASYISGFIDGDGCIFIRKIRDGYQSGISIAQSRTNILQVVMQHFGGIITATSNRNSNTTDKILEDGYFDKFSIRNEYNLMIRSNEYSKILDEEVIFLIAYYHCYCYYNSYYYIFFLFNICF